MNRGLPRKPLPTGAVVHPTAEDGGYGSFLINFLPLSPKEAWKGKKRKVFLF
jgi:hypothetical protein